MLLFGVARDDFLVRQALGDQLDHFNFALGKIVWPLRARHGATLRSRIARPAPLGSCQK
jgi:hypothetical protein